MPNWCENNLSVYGKVEDMKKFMDVISNGDGSYSLLEKLYPTPQELLDSTANFAKEETATDEQKALKEKYGYYDWYEWRIAKWGTKWTEDDLFIGQDYTEKNGNAVIAFNFNTAWAPPIEAFDKISVDYPKLVFCLYYEEPGMCFCGKNIWANGECQENYSAELVTRYFDEEYLYDEYITKNNNK